MPSKIKDKFARQPISRSLASYRRKREALSKNGGARRTPEMFASEKLQPLVDWIAQNPEKPFRRIQDEFSKHSKVPDIGDFKKWLHKNNKDRVQCRFGVGLILVKVHEALTAKEQFGKEKP